jgi:deoxyribonuclease-4
MMGSAAPGCRFWQQRAGRRLAEGRRFGPNESGPAPSLRHASVMTTKWIFGPAELPDKRGFKVSFEKLRELKYKALQISMANENTLDEEKAREVAELNDKYKIHLSVHAPYYCFVTHDDRESRRRALEALVECARMVKIIGGEFVVFHPGLYQGRPRDKVMKVVEDNLMRLEDMIADADLEDISFHAENVSRHDEFGQLDDVIEISTKSELVFPCVDWSHIHACAFGGLKRQSHFDDVLKKIRQAIGPERLHASSFHYADTEHRDGIERQHVNFGEGDLLLRPIVKAVEDAKMERCVLISECPGEPNHQLIFAQMKKYSADGIFV